MVKGIRLLRLLFKHVAFKRNFFFGSKKIRLKVEIQVQFPKKKFGCCSFFMEVGNNPVFLIKLTTFYVSGLKRPVVDVQWLNEIMNHDQSLTKFPCSMNITNLFCNDKEKKFIQRERHLLSSSTTRNINPKKYHVKSYSRDSIENNEFPATEQVSGCSANQ